MVQASSKPSTIHQRQQPVNEPYSQQHNSEGIKMRPTTNATSRRNAHLQCKSNSSRHNCSEKCRQRSLVKPKMKDRRSHLAHLARVSNNHYGASSPAVNSPAVFSPTVYGNTSTPQECGNCLQRRTE